MRNSQYVKSLGMSYTYDGDTCTFPDATRYKPSEMLALSECCVNTRNGRGERAPDMKKLHLVKKLFSGEFLRPDAHPDSPYTRKQTVAAAIQADTTRIALQHHQALKEEAMAKAKVKFDYSKPVCVNCGRTDFVILTKGPHMGAYCRSCSFWQSWLPKRVADVLLRTHPAYSHEKEEAKQENLFGHPA